MDVGDVGYSRNGLNQWIYALIGKAVGDVDRIGLGYALYFGIVIVAEWMSSMDGFLAFCAVMPLIVSTDRKRCSLRLSTMNNMITLY